MIVGDAIPRTIYVQNAAGQFVSFASYALFQAAGFSITFYDSTGVALASQPTITLPVAAVNGRHQFTYIMPNNPWTARVVCTNPNLLPSPVEFDGEGTSYDIDTVGSAIATSSGVALSDTALSGSVQMFDGNSIDVSCAVTEAALSKIGATSLANCDSLVAEIKLNSLDSSVAASVPGLIETITSDVVNTRTVRVTLDAFPAVLAVPTGSQQAVQATLQLKLLKGTKVITANSTQITVKWKATTA
jgi:hypothetical protein